MNIVRGYCVLICQTIVKRSTSTHTLPIVKKSYGCALPYMNAHETQRRSVSVRVFFFQAEDGIRDDLVTGVQTCALPIYDRSGAEIAHEHVRIPCSGSLFWRYGEAFDAATRARAGENAHIVIRDTTCRLFGYHGLIGRNGALSLDHMLGF